MVNQRCDWFFIVCLNMDKQDLQDSGIKKYRSSMLSLVRPHTRLGLIIEMVRGFPSMLIRACNYEHSKS